MRIGMILDSDFPPDPRVENEAVTLIKNGYEVYLFSLSFDKNFTANEIYNGIHVVRCYCPPIVYKFMALAYTLPLYHLYFRKPILKFLMSYKIDTVHIHDMQIARSIFYLKKSINSTIVLDLHENRPEIMKYYKHVNTFPGKYLIFPSIWKKFEKKYIQLSDRVVVVTNSAKEYYVNLYGVNPGKIFVVPNTVREKFYREYKLNRQIVERFKGKFNFLYLGETGRRRGMFELIDAMKKAINMGVEANLIIVGTSKDEYLLKEKVKKNNLGKNVFIEGWKDFGLFQSYLTVADVGVCPLHRNIHHDTTFANKIFQYASFGLPVIASNSTAQKRVLDKMQCGLFHEAKNSDDLAKKLFEIYKKKDLRNKLSTNAIEAIRTKYKWEIISMSLIDLYQGIK
jgi:glycosyltransferase involved in cell wall biosynthesis